METFNQIIDWVQWGLMVGISGAITQWTVCCVINVHYTEGHWFVEQEMLTIPKYMSSPPSFQWISRCSTCVMLCRSLFVLFPLAIFSPVLRFTASDYLFGILKLFCAPWCLFCIVEIVLVLVGVDQRTVYERKIHIIYKISDICK